MKWAGVAVSPIIRASKYSITSLKRLNIERCASSNMIRSKKPGLNFSKQRPGQEEPRPWKGGKMSPAGHAYSKGL
jgi:hypothetical protein